jgi:hypothetical protein
MRPSATPEIAAMIANIATGRTLSSNLETGHNQKELKVKAFKMPSEDKGLTRTRSLQPYEDCGCPTANYAWTSTATMRVLCYVCEALWNAVSSRQYFVTAQLEWEKENKRARLR